MRKLFSHLRKLFRRILCRLGLHYWLTGRKARIWKGDAVEVFNMQEVCGYCPAQRPSRNDGDWDGKEIDVRDPALPVDAEIVLMEPDMLMEVIVDE